MKTIGNKKRVGALLLAVAMVFSLFSNELVGFVWADTGAAVCEDCGQEPCICEAPAAVCEDCGQDPCVCTPVNVCETCGQDPCVCTPVNVCETCGQDPCACTPVNVCETCGQDPCVCVPVNVCETCSKDPCVCAPVNVCETCGQEPCVCVPVNVCETCSKDPCVCVPVNVCETCGQNPCSCAVAVCEFCGVQLVEGALHTADCLSQCTCSYTAGVHQQGCALYVKVCTCDPAADEGEPHLEGCAFYDPANARCEECGNSVNAHKITCSEILKKYAIAKTIEGTQVTVTAEGILPEGLEISASIPWGFVPDFDHLTKELIFVVDITLTDSEGNEWQPEPGQRISVSVDASSLGLEDGEVIEIYHIHEGKTRNLGKVTSEDGVLTFKTTGFSTFYGLQTTALAAAADGVIYFDLAAGNVTINASTYSGYVYKYGTTTQEKIEVSGSHNNNNKYYVYQTNGSNYANTGYKEEDDTVTPPTYERVKHDGKDWGDYVTNNTNPTEVARNWQSDASDRVGTSNWISIKGNGTYQVTIDNLWSTKNVESVSRTDGGIAFIPENGGKTYVNMKGDNRFGNIYYSYVGEKAPDSQGFVNGTGIVFANGEDSNTVPGSMTVVSYNGKENHYNSVIGGNDNGKTHEWSCGIIINSGVVYAGAQTKDNYTGKNQTDNCSAIGGGGNGKGVVTITGGKVTAVVSSTGAAIGGGIGESSYGGDGVVTITGGEVYAYNFGYVTFDKSIGYTVPAAAIGGASSRDSTGATGTVTITGGKVYAESVGGAAIGGGSSTKNRGGDTTIAISGDAEVTALSVAGYVNNENYYVEAGVSIGGGTAGSLGEAAGGSATLSIAGGTIKTGSIGGGACNNDVGTIGFANVTISGGTTQGQVIMASGASKACQFTMTGGLLDNRPDPDDPYRDQYVFLEDNGGAVWMDDADGVAAISGGTIQNCSADNGGAVYMTAGSFTMSGSGKISNCTAAENGGAVYLGGGTVTLFGGSIESCHAQTGGGVYLTGGNAFVSGGKILNCYAQKDKATGGGIYVFGGNVTMSAGSIEGCLTKDASGNISGQGGGVYVSGGKMELSGGEVKGNQATNGGGVYLPGGDFDMTGGILMQNQATGNGGGVYLNGGNLTLKGASAKIKENQAIHGAGVYLVGGTPGLYEGTLSGNTATGNGGGIYIDKQIVELRPTGTVLLQSNNAVNGAGIYINGTEVGAGQDPDAGFTVLECTGTVELDGNTATQAGGGVCVNNGYFYMGFDNIRIVKNGAANGGGVAVLSGAFAMAQGNIGEEGYANTASNGGGVYVRGGSAAINGGTVQYNSATGNGGGVAVDGGSATIDGGTVQHNMATGSGGGVSVSGGSVTIDSGTVQDNSATIGGGASVSGGATSAAVINGGTVQNNTATDMGGGVAVSGGSATINGGDVQTNTAPIGGGIYVSGGSATINGGTVQHNTATANGGGVAVDGGSAIINGGDVKTNTAPMGGGIYVSGGNLTLSGGNITGNTADTNGGGFYVDNGTFEMEPRKKDGEKLISTISGNTASYGGGGYVNGGDVIIIEGDIENNRATNDGGGIYVTTTSTEVSVTMLSGHLQENTAENGNGGGMAVVNDSGTNMEVTVGCLMNHEVGGVFSHTPKFGYEGDDIYDQYKPHTHDYCPIVSKNEAKKNGGGFYLSGNNSKLSFYCIEESGNKAENNTNCYSLDVEGGQVEIGDAPYHNCNKKDPKYPSVRGYVEFNSTILVTGGDVNIYGDMDNPIFKEQITVDIKLSGGSFTDHRRVAETEVPQYKVHYVENFPESESVRTGTYTVDQVQATWNSETKKYECWIEIPGANFSHPGFKITGWFTHPDGGGEHADGKKGHEYTVAKKYNLCDEALKGMGTETTCTDECCKDGDSKILKLYAQWDRKGYLIVFNSNQPTGATIIGEMEKQKCSQDIIYNLNPNAYQCLGYVFQGWAETKSATTPKYTDGQSIRNLTMLDSKEVDLYAVWEECRHKDEDLKYTASGNSLTETCEKCKITYGSGKVEYEHEAKVSVQGRTGDYTGTPYPARLNGAIDSWLGDNLTVIYFKDYDEVWDKDWEKPGADGVYEKWGDGDEDAPIHAGTYQAKISVNGQTVFAGGTASNNVVIERVQWPTPEAPTLTYDLKEKKVTITSPLDSVVDGVSYVYQYNCPELIGENWSTKTEYADIKDFNKFYYFKAQQVEDRNHTTSKASEASVFLSENGSSVVYFILDEGAARSITTEPGAVNRMDFKVETVGGYHKRGWTVTVNVEGLKNGSDVGGIYTYDGNNDIYTLPNLTVADAFIVTVKGTAKDAVAAAITENGQVFDDIIDQEVSISQDSAFTIQYSVTDYHPDEYKSQSLAFSQALPQNTKLIMMTRDGSNVPQYWYYVVDDADGEDTLELNQFRPMGVQGDDTYQYPTGSEKINYTQRFVVDFSQASSKPTAGTLKMTYQLMKSEEVIINEVGYPCFAPDIVLDKNNQLHAAATFALNGTSESENGAATVTYAYDPSEGHASIWEGRNSALVFTLNDGAASGQAKPELPADLKLTVRSGDGATDYALQEGNKFILPLGDLNKLTDEETVQLSLKSDLFTASGTLNFDVQWYVSASAASSAPMEGTVVVKTDKPIKLSATKASQASLLITGNPENNAEQRFATVGGTLTAWVTRKNTSGLTIRARLLREKEVQYDTPTALEYVDTLYKQDLFVNAGVDVTQEKCTVSLVGQQPGNFCLHVVAIEGEGENQVYKAEAKYYFIVEAAESGEGTNGSEGSGDSSNSNDMGEAESSSSATVNE